MVDNIDKKRIERFKQLSRIQRRDLINMLSGITSVSKTTPKSDIISDILDTEFRRGRI